MTFLRSRLPAFACSAVFLLCELISRPWVEMGISDDWSYIRSAQLLAQTGHIHYNGWATAMIGWQLYLAAAFIKIFGFSFTAARIPVLLIAIFTVYLMQRTLVRLGLTDANAVLGTLTFSLSPLWLVLSPTMMTDIPGFFAILACIYGCIRAIQSPRDRNAILWLGFAVAVNDICGTSRQIAWLGVFVLLPSTLWLLRRRRRVFLCGLAATALGFLFIFGSAYWFSRQPYIIPEPFPRPPVHLWQWKKLGGEGQKTVRLLGLLVFPMCLPFIAAARRFSLRSFAGLAALGVLFVAFIYAIGGTHELHSLVYPLLNDCIIPPGLYQTGWPIHSLPPVVLQPWLLHILSAFAMTGILCVAATVLIARPLPLDSRPTGERPWSFLAVFLGPLFFAYFFLLSYRAIWAVFDRYLLTPVFLILFFLLLYTQQRLKIRWYRATYIAIAAIAFYGIITTHNTFAFNRARVTLANEILATGLPPSNADLGWEMNNWYGLQISDYINDPRLTRPAGSYHLYPLKGPTNCQDGESNFLPHLAPHYGFSFDPKACDGVAPFAPATYSTWPLRKPTTLYVVKYPAPWLSAIDLEKPSSTSPDTAK